MAFYIIKFGILFISFAASASSKAWLRGSSGSANAARPFHAVQIRGLSRDAGLSCCANSAYLGLQSRASCALPLKPYPMEDFHNVCRLRATLEAFAVLQLREEFHQGQLMERLRGHLAQMHAHASHGDYEAFHETDMNLHRELVASCAMPTLTQSWELTVNATSKAVLKIKKTHWPSLMALYREHIYLLDAWQSEDPLVAERATHHHLEVGWYRLLISKGTIPPEGDAVDRVASFLSTHYASEIYVEWVARNIGFVSATHLSRRFRAQFGVAPYEWLRNLRLERAAQLLATTSEEVVKVGARVGYKNASHFTRDFRAKFKITPKKYRHAGSLPQ